MDIAPKPDSQFWFSGSHRVYADDSKASAVFSGAGHQMKV